MTGSTDIDVKVPFNKGDWVKFNRTPNTENIFKDADGLPILLPAEDEIGLVLLKSSFDVGVYFPDWEGGCDLHGCIPDGACGSGWYFEQESVKSLQYSESWSNLTMVQKAYRG